MPTKRFTRLALRVVLLFIAASAVLILVIAASVALRAQVSPGKELQLVSVTYSEPTSAAPMYKNYCAVCHGMEGRGDGPAVGFLKTPPPDLRTLARRHDGKYPANYVSETMRLGTGSHAHGTIDMPLWGPLFRTLDANQSLGELRIHNLTVFIESLQQK